MTTLDSREQAFENKYAHDAELKFRITARRNKLLGWWAAGLLNKADADAYAKEVVASDFEKPGNEDVVEKVLADFKAAGVNHSADDIRAKMAELLAEAEAQVKG